MGTWNRDGRLGLFSVHAIFIDGLDPWPLWFSSLFLTAVKRKEDTNKNNSLHTALSWELEKKLATLVSSLFSS